MNILLNGINWFFNDDEVTLESLKKHYIKKESTINKDDFLVATIDHLTNEQHKELRYFISEDT